MACLVQRRLLKELSICHRWQHDQVVVRPPDDGNLQELHFVLHGLPHDTPYHHGCYHGKISFPRKYPMAPPAIQMLTESGRFRTRTDICTTASNWHHEQWNPDWTVMTILIGFLSLFLDERDQGVGHINSVSMTDQCRRELAAKSWEANADDEEFCKIFPEFRRAPQTSSTASSSASLPSLQSLAVSSVKLAGIPEGGIPCPKLSIGRGKAGSAVGSTKSGAGTSSAGSSSAAAAAATIESGTGATKASAGATGTCAGSASSGSTEDAVLSVVPERPRGSGAEASIVAGTAAAEARVMASAAAGSTDTASTAGAGGDDDDDPVVCRFCFEDGTEEPLMDPAPCACRGSMGGAHAKCLQQWILCSGHLKCNTCNGKYVDALLALDHPDKLLDVTARLLSIHTGVHCALIVTCLGTVAFTRISIHLNLDLPTIGMYLAAMCLGWCAGRLLTKEPEQRVPGPEGLEKPLFPVAVAELVRLRFARASRRRGLHVGGLAQAGFDDADVAAERLADRALVTKAARPEIGLGCAAGCGALFMAVSLSTSSTNMGLLAMWSAWIIICHACRIVEVRTKRQVLQLGPEQHGFIDTMTMLGAARAGSFWSLVCVCFVLVAVLHRSVHIALGLTAIQAYAGTAFSGLFVGHCLTRGSTSGWQEAPRAPMNEGQGDLGEPLRPGAETVRTLVESRIQVQRAVALQLMQATSCTLWFGCCAVCIAFYYCCTLWASALVDTATLALSLLWICLAGATRVAVRRFRAAWQLHMHRMGKSIR